MALRRLMIITLACLTIVFIFVNYTYRPALLFYNLFSSLVDRVSLLVLGTQPLEDPYSYRAFSQAWRSSGSYLSLTGLQWLIALTSLVAWALGIPRLSKMDQRRWLLWLMYTAFGVLLALGVVVDFAGFLNTNLQLRMFTPFALFSSPLAAELIQRGYQSISARWRRLVTFPFMVIVVYAALALVLKVTNDPSFGNQWFFYSPAELKTGGWINTHVQQQVWVDTWSHLYKVFYFWEEYTPSIANQYRWGELHSPAPYTLISRLTRLRANRIGLSLPDTLDQNRVYDNGVVQLYHRRALTPYQR